MDTFVRDILPTITNYTPLDNFVGFMVGMIGGIVASFLGPLRIHKFPATFADIVAIAGTLILCFLPILFPHTLIIITVISFMVFWFFMPSLFGKRFPSGGEKLVDASLIEALSPEGRVAVLEALGVLPSSKTSMDADEENGIHDDFTILPAANSME